MSLERTNLISDHYAGSISSSPFMVRGSSSVHDDGHGPLGIGMHKFSTLHTCARGKAIGSVVVVDTKITKSGYLDVLLSCQKYNWLQYTWK